MSRLEELLGVLRANPDQNHPSAPELSSYLNGTVSAEAKLTMDRHLVACSDCFAKLEKMDESQKPGLRETQIVTRTKPRRLSVLVRVSTPIILVALIAGVVGAAAVKLAEWWNSKPVHIVIGSTKVRTMDGIESDRYIGIDDTRAAVVWLNGLLEGGFRPSDFRLQDAKQAKFPIERGTVICIGGPNANPLTLSYLSSLTTGDRGFRFVTSKDIPANKFSRPSQARPYGIEDIETGEISPADREKGLDCALVVMGRDRARDVPVIIIAGHGADATYAIAEALVQKGGELSSKLRPLYLQHGYVEAVVSVERGQIPRFHEFTKVVNPRTQSKP